MQPMLPLIFEHLRSYLRFSPEDEANLEFLAGRLEGYFPGVVSAFYVALEADPTAMTLIRDRAQLERLRRSLEDWLRTVLRGPYDQRYLERRAGIGRRHVEIDMPPRLMVAGMSVIRRELTTMTMRLELPDAAAKLASLNKMLDIELAMMLGTFHEHYVENIRAAGRQVMEARLKESQQLATVGQLAASLAHEIKNPLAGISGAIQVIRDTLALDNPHREIIDEILSQIDRLDNAVKDLLVFARPTPPRLAPHRLSELIEKTARMLREEPAVRRMEFVIAEDHSELRVRADEHQVQQVLTNLFINAAHACEGRGRIDVHTVRVGDRVRLEVRDNGRGMTEEVRAAAFEPFYTTKAKGTGLGLAICKKIVAAHHGDIHIESAPGRGTTVVVDLPVWGLADDSVDSERDG